MNAGSQIQAWAVALTSILSFASFFVLTINITVSCTEVSHRHGSSTPLHVNTTDQRLQLYSSNNAIIVYTVQNSHAKHAYHTVISIKRRINKRLIKKWCHLSFNSRLKNNEEKRKYGILIMCGLSGSYDLNTLYNNSILLV